MATILLKGSERKVMAGARVLAPADPTERLEVSVLLRRRAHQDFAARVSALTAHPAPRSFLSREEFAVRHGADTADLAAIAKFAAAHSLQVVQESAARRTVLLSGTVAQFSAAFNVRLEIMEHENCSYRGRTGTIEIPAELDGVIEAVLGLDSRPQAAPHFRIRRNVGNVKWRAGATAATSYSPLEVASLYDFPQGTGAGECIAIVELGGGYRPADLAAYFSGLGVANPAVVPVSVDHAQNTPTGDPNGPDGEVMLDIEVVGAIAPQAKIVVYFAPNTDAGFLNAITTAIHDTTNKPSVISISWGGPESSWTSQAMSAMDSAFQAAATMGITVCIASGDNGSSDGVTDGADHVDFPASSPYALACGGTSLHASGGRILSEVVWNDGAGNGATGGGISGFFPAATWQSGFKATTASGKSSVLSMRGLPDVAGNADPETGYEVRIDGTNSVIGGTSAVAPLWAALIARLNQVGGTPLGYANPLLYASAASLRDITQGANGDFVATPDWDACTGLGSPNGTALAGSMKV